MRKEEESEKNKTRGELYLQRFENREYLAEA